MNAPNLIVLFTGLVLFIHSTTSHRGTPVNALLGCLMMFITASALVMDIVQQAVAP